MRGFLARVRAGEVDPCTNTEVLQEILYRYSALGRCDLAGRVYDLFVQVCPAVLAVTLADTDRARRLLAKLSKLSARDTAHVDVTLNKQVHAGATFDAASELVAGVKHQPLE